MWMINPGIELRRPKHAIPNVSFPSAVAGSDCRIPACSPRELPGSRRMQALPLGAKPA